jgi:Yip1-like protein
MNVFARFVGIIVSPKDTFQNVAAHPRWLGMALLVSLLIGIFAALPLTTPGGKQAYIDQSVKAVERFGFEVNDEMYAGMQKSAETAVYTTAISMLFAIPIGSLIAGGILFAVFNAAMGGNARFKQVYAVVIHCGVISAIGAAFTGLINYSRGTMNNSVANVGALLPFLSEDSFVANVLGMLDVFQIWGILVTAIGLAVLYRRRTQPIATTLFVIYGVILLGIAALMSR